MSPAVKGWHVSPAVSVNDVIQLPCIVSVQFCFGTGFDSLVYEGERVVFRFG